MRILLRVLTVLLMVLLALGGLAYVGLQVQPKPFAPYPEATPKLKTVPVPNLPDPVARFYAVAVGDRAPVIESVVLSGSGSIRLNGLRFPSRYRFTHQAGQGYRHYMEATVFGLPLFKVNEWYLHGHARMELPVGVIENEAKSDQAANLTLWAESITLPSLFVTDPRVRWEYIDETHAALVVPAGEETDRFTVTFDVETGLPVSLDAARWKDPSSPTKLNWHIDLSNWQRHSGMLIPTGWALTWEDEKGSWFVGQINEVIYNVDVEGYIGAAGP